MAPESLPALERADLVCDCYCGAEELWGPACNKFEDDDQGECMNCGHDEECHERP